jgi:hypothetical protein
MLRVCVDCSSVCRDMQKGKQFASVGMHVSESRTTHNGMTITVVSDVPDVTCPSTCVKLNGSTKLRSDRSPPTAGEGDEKRLREKRIEFTHTTIELHVSPARTCPTEGAPYVLEASPVPSLVVVIVRLTIPYRINTDSVLIWNGHVCSAYDERVLLSVTLNNKQQIYT